MRISENRLRVRKLFVLGAGASYGASLPKSGPGPYVAPLDKDFTTTLVELDVKKPAWVKDTLKRSLNQWKDHRAVDSIGLEEAVLHQLGHLEFLSGIHPRRAREAPSPGEWLSDIAHLVCFLLQRCRQSSRQLYDVFADRVFDSDLPADEQPNRVITFNYDTLLDNTLLERFTPQEVYFDRISGSSSVGSTSITVDNPLMLKLHGSINWRCGLNDFKHIVNFGGRTDDDPIELGEIALRGKPSPVPSDDECPLIIPPLPAKPITAISIFRYLWTRAYEYLYGAHELVICGYSLPPADQMAVSMFSNFRNTSLDRVTLIDPSPTALLRWRDVLRRPTVKIREWTYCETFAEYLERA